MLWVMGGWQIVPIVINTVVMSADSIPWNATG